MDSKCSQALRPHLFPGFAAPFLIGLVSAPLVKPLVRGAVKATVGLALRLKQLAAEASEEFQDIAAEASADFAGAEARRQSGVSKVTAPKKG
ncbi:MAG: DUF5132 domain-containing protein [Actinomycetota bacterium]